MSSLHGIAYSTTSCFQRFFNAVLRSTQIDAADVLAARSERLKEAVSLALVLKRTVSALSIDNFISTCIYIDNVNK